jgi:hypothetical protein
MKSTRTKVLIGIVAIIVLAIIFLLSTKQASAEETPPISFNRVAFTLGGGITNYDKAHSELVGTSTPAMMMSAISYSFGPMISAGIKGSYDLNTDLAPIEFGPRMLVVGDGSDQKTQVAFGANIVWYEGSGIEAFNFTNKTSWNAGLYASYQIAKNPSLAWYVTGDATYDQQNKFNEFHAMVRMVGLPYKWF